MPIIETSRLELRELTKADSYELHKVLGDPETMQFYPSPYTIEAVKGWIDRSIESYKDHGFGLWAVILKETNQFIGQCGISIQNIDGEQVSEIGYHINKQYWNQGYATEASRACMQYGFRQLGLDELFIHTYVKNIPSQRIAEKLGMRKIKEYDKYIQSHGLTWRHVVFEMKKEAFYHI